MRRRLEARHQNVEEACSPDIVLHQHDQVVARQTQAQLGRARVLDVRKGPSQLCGQTSLRKVINILNRESMTGFWTT